MPERPRTGAEVEVLVRRMAEENRDWGYRRIQGALANLGYVLAHNTIAKIFARYGRFDAIQGGYPLGLGEKRRGKKELEQTPSSGPEA